MNPYRSKNNGDILIIIISLDTLYVVLSYGIYIICVYHMVCVQISSKAVEHLIKRGKVKRFEIQKRDG